MLFRFTASMSPPLCGLVKSTQQNPFIQQVFLRVLLTLSTKNTVTQRIFCHIFRVENFLPSLQKTKISVKKTPWLQRLSGTLVDVFGVIHSMVGGEKHRHMLGGHKGGKSSRKPWKIKVLAT